MAEDPQYAERIQAYWRTSSAEWTANNPERRKAIDRAAYLRARARKLQVAEMGSETGQ